MQPVKMTAFEHRSAFSLAGIFAFRLLGLFIVLPLLAIYAGRLHGVTPMLLGISMGIYGLTQALLQMPFGMLSDRFGRKPIITLGLLMFALGSIVAALSTNIYGLILGRALQGAGAIGSTLLALLADLTREEHRSKAMAVVGMIIGLSFSVALLLGPFLEQFIGIKGLFWLTTFLAGCGLFVLYFIVPNPKQSIFHRDTEPEPEQLISILKNRELLRLDLGIFLLHAILTASFVAIPVLLRDKAHIPVSQQWEIYLVVLLSAFAMMIPAIIVAEKKYLKPVFLSAIGCIALAELGLFFNHQIFYVTICLSLFLGAFSVLEALLPSLVAKVAPAAHKGSAMGIYSSAQFFGIFAGGLFGGRLYGSHATSGVFLGSCLLACIWFIVAKTMQQPRLISTYMIKIGPRCQGNSQSICDQLLDIHGVLEATVTDDDGIAYLKVDKRLLDFTLLHKFSMVN